MGFSNTTVPGLKAWFDAAAGVTLSGSDVTLWADQSGNGFDLAPPGGVDNPTFHAGVVNGRPGVLFDTVTGNAQLNNSFAGGIATDGPRYVVAVLRPTIPTVGPQPAGFSWGGPFATINASGGLFYPVLGDYTGNLYVTGNYNFTPDPTAANTAYLYEWGSTGGAGALSLYLDGAAIGPGGYTSSADGGAQLIVGSDNSQGNGSFSGYICELLIFDHVLVGSELDAVRDYLTGKYFPIPATGLTLWLKGDDISGVDGDPIASWSDASGNGFDAAQVTGGLQPTLRIGANGINGHSVAEVSESAGTFMQGTVNFGAPTGTTVVYVAKAGSNNIAPYTAPTGLGTPEFDTFGLGPDATWGAGWAEGGLGFNGVDGYTVGQPRYAIYNYDGSTTWTMSGVNNGTTTADTAPPFTSGAFWVGSSGDAGTQFDGLVAEIIMWNRALTPTEVAQVKLYIHNKYGISTDETPLSISPSAPTVVAGASQTFAGADGSGTGYTYTLTTNNSGGTIDLSTGVYTAGVTGSVTDTVTVTDSFGNTADAVVTVTTGGPIPTTGLQVWVKADAGVTLSGSDVTNWADQSGNGMDFVPPAANPQFVASAINGLPAVSFDGSSQYLTSALQLSGAKHVFFVRKLSVLPSGGAFSCPYQINGGGGHSGSPFYYNDGTAGWLPVTFVDDLTAAVGSSQGVSIVLDTAWHTDEHTYNGGGNTTPGNYGYTLDGAVQTVVSDNHEGDFPTITVSSMGVDFAAGVPAGDWFNGDIAEFIVYDHVLSGPDLATVQAYLTAKYFPGGSLAISPTSVTLPPLGTQTFTGSGGTAPYAYSISTNNSGGSINPTTGDYVAGTTGSVADTITVTDAVMATADATATVTAGVTLSPGSVTLAPGGTQTFTASGGSGTGFVYGFSFNGSGGTINSSTGDYTAGNVAANDQIVATDSLGNVSADSTVTIPGVVVSPSSASLAPLQSANFSAMGGSGTGFTWAIIVNNSGGSINSSGHYVAGSTGSVTDTIQATDSLGNTSAGTDVTVTAALAIVPSTVTVGPRVGYTFSSTGGSGVGDTFSLFHNNSGGSINSSTGAYVAGTTPNVTDTVRVVDNTGAHSDAIVTVGPALTIIPSTTSLNKGGTLTFSHAGGSGTGIAFSLTQNQSGGSVNSSTGFYTAGSGGGNPAVDIVLVSDDAGNTASATVSAYPPNFFVQGITLIGLSTLRVKFSYPPKALDPDATNDGLHPANYVLVGNDVTYVITCLPVLGDDRSIDCLMAAPFGFGKWTLSVSNVQSADGGQTL